MNRITTIKKNFCLLMINLVLVNPVLLAGNSSSTVAKTNRSRIKNRKISRRQQQGNPIVATHVVAQPQIENPADLRKAHEAQQARNEQARSVLGRKEEKNTFAKKIDAYAAKVKNEHGHKDVSGKIIATSLDKIKGSDLLIDVKKIIDPINKRVAGQEGEKLAVQEQLGLALLLKTSLPLGQQAFSITCEMLHKLDNYISYWRDQKHHQMSHFFHKNPKKWFVGTKQKVEIEENLKKLVAPRDVHLGLLYKLAEHESLFDQNASMQDQYKWLARYLELISNICYNVQAKLDGVVKDEANRFEKMLTLVNDMLGRASFHESNVDRYLAEAKKPGHFTRNWIAYTGLAIGSSLLAWHAYKNQQKFSNWFYSDVQQGAAYVSDFVYKSGSDAYKAFIGKSDGQAEVVNFNQVQIDLNRQFDAAHTDLRQLGREINVAGDEIGVRVNRHYPPAEEQNRQRDVYQAGLTAIANYLEGRDVLVQNNTLASLTEQVQIAGLANDNNAVPQPVNLAAEQLKNVVRTTVLPRLDKAQEQSVQQARAMQEHRVAILRGALEQAIADVAQDEKPQVLSGILREALTQAIADIQNGTASLQDVKPSKAWTDAGAAVAGAAEIARKLPQVGGVVALFGHVTAMFRVSTQDASNGLGGFGATGANIVRYLAGFMNTLADMINRPRIETINRVNVPVVQRDANGQPVLDAHGAQIPVMEPGPLRAGAASTIGLAQNIDKLLTQQKATFAFAALLPVGVVVGGTCFGASKLYKAVKHKPDFKPIREALIDIGHLLNEEGMVKKIEDEQLDQGRILYLVWKLKREADNVPSLQRDQFLADVNRLGKSDLDNGRRIWTAEKKLRIIDLMYRTYDFLNPSYVTQ